MSGRHPESECNAKTCKARIALVLADPVTGSVFLAVTWTVCFRRWLGFIGKSAEEQLEIKGVRGGYVDISEQVLLCWSELVNIDGDMWERYRGKVGFEESGYFSQAAAVYGCKSLETFCDHSHRNSLKFVLPGLTAVDLEGNGFIFASISCFV